MTTAIVAESLSARGTNNGEDSAAPRRVDLTITVPALRMDAHAGTQIAITLDAWLLPT